MPGLVVPVPAALPLPEPAVARPEPSEDFAVLLAAVTAPTVEPAADCPPPPVEPEVAQDPALLCVPLVPAVPVVAPPPLAPTAPPATAATSTPPDASTTTAPPPVQASRAAVGVPEPLDAPAPPQPAQPPVLAAGLESAGPPSTMESPALQPEALPAATAVVLAPAAPLPAGPPLPVGPAAGPTLPAPPPVAQVALALAPVLTGPDGSYSMSLELYPEELGTVSVEVSVRGGTISMSVQATGAEALQALRTALPELTAQLESTGLTATDVSVGERDARERPDGTPRRGTRPGDGGSAAPADEPATVPAGSTSSLDVRI